MAFVYRSDRKLDLSTAQTQSSVGPGSYIAHRDYKIPHSPVPFNSQSTRSQISKLQQSLPGPGYYDQHDQLDSQKVLLHAGGSEVRIIEVSPQTAQFKSNVNRFNEIKDFTPGPGQYFDELKDSKPQRKIQTKQKSSTIESIFNRNKYISIPSIPSKGQAFGYHQSQDKIEFNKKIKENVDELVGPGKYDLDVNIQKPKGAPFHKSRVVRLASVVNRDSQAAVGPGSYDTDRKFIPLYKLQPSSGFQSQAMREYQQRRGEKVAQYMYQRLQQAQKNFLENDLDFSYEISQQTPGPGHYNPQINTQPSVERPKEQVFAFGSQSQRFPSMNKNPSLGPGSYTDPSMKQVQSAVFKQPPFLSSNVRFDTQLTMGGPGPQAYKNPLTLEEKILEKRRRGPLGNFMANEERFSKRQKEILPGPGAYNPIIESPQNQASQSVFKSVSKRDPFTQNSVDEIPPPGAYDQSQNTISQKVQMILEAESELDIVKPGFNSGEKRFDFEKTKPSHEEQEVTIEDRKLNAVFLKKPKKAAPFNTGDERFVQKPPEDMPGPGEYFEAKKDKWTKQTFNILFSDI